MRGPTHSSQQQFLIKWKGYGEEYDSWQDRKNIDPDFVVEFLKANGHYDYSCPGVRCPCCTDNTRVYHNTDNTDRESAMGDATSKDSTALAGREVRLRIYFRDATVYAVGSSDPISQHQKIVINFSQGVTGF